MQRAARCGAGADRGDPARFGRAPGGGCTVRRRMNSRRMATSLSLQAALTEVGEEVDRRFDALLTIPDDPRAGLYRAMRHAAIGGGKRPGPLLVFATANLFDVARECSARAATAIEA